MNDDHSARPSAADPAPTAPVRPSPPSRWLVALAYLAITIVFTWPVALVADRDVPGDLGDSLLNMWILGWGAEHIPALVTGRFGWTEYWNGNIFHPEPYALALSEHLFAQGLQAAPIYALTRNVILCYNLLFLSTFFLSALGVYLLVEDLTGDWRAAFVAGLVFGFLPYRVSQIPHLQLLSSQWMPFALLGLRRFISSGSGRALAAGSAALVLQNWSCGYYLLYFAPFVPLFALHQMATAGRLSDRRCWAGLAIAAIAVAGLTLPFLLPYLHVQRLHALERPLGEVIAFSANVWSYATAAEPIHLWGRLLRLHPHGEGETFLGVTAAIVAGVAVAASFADARRASALTPPASGWRRIAGAVLTVLLVVQVLSFLSVMLIGGFNVTLADGLAIRATTPMRTLLQSLLVLGLLLLVSPGARGTFGRWLREPVVFFAALLLLAAWLSLGPFPTAGAQPVSGVGLYGFLYTYVPGFTGLRVPARFAMIAGLFLAIVAGYGAIALRRWHVPSAAIVGLLGALIVGDAAAMPLETNRTWGQTGAMPPARVLPAPAAPPIYQRLAALPAGAAVAEFPFGDLAWEIRYVYYASMHRAPILNGYSGAFPAGYARRAAALARFETNPDAAWQALADAGTTHVVLHLPAFVTRVTAFALITWLESRGARMIDSFPQGDLLYELPARQP